MPEATNAVPPIFNQQTFLIPDEAFSYFDINKPSERIDIDTKKKLNSILSYAWEKTGKGEMGDILASIREIESTFGAGDIGSSRLDRIFHYITIQRQINDLEKQKTSRFNIKKSS